MRAGTPGDQPQPIAEAREVEAERVGHRGFKPANGAGADPGENDALIPGFAKDAIDAVGAPDCEHVRGVAAPDVDHILLEQEGAEFDDGPANDSEARW